MSAGSAMIVYLPSVVIGKFYIGIAVDSQEPRQAESKVMAWILLVFKARLRSISFAALRALVFAAFAEVVGPHEQDYDDVFTPFASLAII
jgi:hypothetical protein